MTLLVIISCQSIVKIVVKLISFNNYCAKAQPWIITKIAKLLKLMRFGQRLAPSRKKNKVWKSIGNREIRYFVLFANFCENQTNIANFLLGSWEKLVRHYNYQDLPKKNFRKVRKRVKIKFIFQWRVMILFTWSILDAFLWHINL